MKMHIVFNSPKLVNFGINKERKDIIDSKETT